MKKQNLRANGGYVLSVEKVKQIFANLGIVVCAGRKRIRAARSENTIIIYADWGIVNISVNEKGGHK